MVKSLTPGERAHNWAQAAVTLWPVIVALIGLLGWTNKDSVMRWTGLAEADGKTEITATGPTFEDQVRKFSEEVRAELIRIESNSVAMDSQLQDADRRAISRLQAQIDQLKAWHD